MKSHWDREGLGRGYSGLPRGCHAADTDSTGLAGWNLKGYHRAEMRLWGLLRDHSMPDVQTSEGIQHGFLWVPKDLTVCVLERCSQEPSQERKKITSSIFLPSSLLSMPLTGSLIGTSWLKECYKCGSHIAGITEKLSLGPRDHRWIVIANPSGLPSIPTLSSTHISTHPALWWGASSGPHTW
jgi:hypothetical protein